ncbi:bifunctional 2-polyprenyl-6-hydroxyphenol methylase/3-demethylubiquinol 3-O-methyltransferase UbiG [Microlunatus sp. Gsoil 973]|uniref:class I SAM-dependent methyltransferase n=1 Tax=Microlunatus sp. Gsoil 973 TaxID=2672569 RepID=UPI0012B4A630|nr:class I SAM-dependent methyltransferase [Microlunatus sp. Gsoil 973]QGN32683.1 methyltransferase domain-containing protein [Microlunatus sp. Gsoil 973]
MTEHDAATEDATRFWEGRYAEKDRIWSGRVNQVLAEVAAELEPGSVLDLGAGEGADAIWLADKGWRVTAVDISETALSRGRDAADRAGVGDRITFERYDLAMDFPAGRFDLVSAQYLHSPVEFPRATVLRNAAAAVADGGRLLIVDHGEPPPWARHHHQNQQGDASEDEDRHEMPDLPPLAETFDSLALSPEEWAVERCDSVERQATGPDGQAGTVLDNIILARRIG